MRGKGHPLSLLVRIAGSGVLLLAAFVFIFGSSSTGGLLAFFGLGIILGEWLRSRGAPVADEHQTIQSVGGVSSRTRILLIGIETALAVALVVLAGVPPSRWSYAILLGSALIALMVGLPGTDGKTTYVVLAQITFIALALRALGWFAYPPALVGVDAWYHAGLADGISTTGTIPVSAYEGFPVMQVAASTTMQLLGIDLRSAMFVAVSVPVSLLLPFSTYLATSRWGGNATAGLFAAFLTGVLPDLVYWGYSPIPMSLSIAFLFLAFMIIVAVTSRTKKTGLLILVFASTLLTHTIGAFILASYFVIASLVSKFAKSLGHPPIKRSHTSMFGPALFIILVAYWLNISGFLFPFIIRAISFGLRLDAFLPPTSAAASLPTAVATALSTGTLLMLAAAGSLLVLHKRSGLSQLLPLVGFAWTTTGVTFVGQQAGFSAILPGRWGAFGLGMLTVPAGIGISRLLAGRTAPKPRAILVAGITVVLISAILFHPALSPVPISATSSPRLGFVPSESAAASWISHFRAGPPIYSDSLMILQLGSTLDPNVRDGSQVLTSNGPWHGYFVLRKDAALQSIYILSQGKVFWHSYTATPESIQRVQSAPVSAIYSSGSTTVLWSA